MGNPRQKLSSSSASPSNSKEPDPTTSALPFKKVRVIKNGDAIASSNRWKRLASRVSAHLPSAREERSIDYEVHDNEEKKMAQMIKKSDLLRVKLKPLEQNQEPVKTDQQDDHESLAATASAMGRKWKNNSAPMSEEDYDK